MDCREIRENISAYVDGEATEEEARQVAEHLRTCAACLAVEKRMRALGDAALRTEASVSPGFRDRLFSRMEREGLLAPRRSLFAFSVRWTAVPLAAAAALAVFLLVARETPRVVSSPAGGPARVAGETTHPLTGSPPGSLSRDSTRAAPASPAVAGAGEGTAPVASKGVELSGEDRAVVANLDLLEDPDLFDEGRMEEMEIFIPSSMQRG